MANTMKVRITLTIDVDRESWSDMYGTTDAATEVREDVRSYVLNQIQQSAAADDGGIVSARIG